MQAMSTEMATLLKSGKQIGANKPTAEVIIGQGEGIELWTNVKAIRATDTYTEWGGGSFVTRSDGKILVTYSNLTTKKIYLSVVDSEDDIFYEHNASSVNEWEFITLAGISGLHSSILQKLANGKILLYVFDAGQDLEDSWVKVYISDNGLGTDFVYLSTVRSMTRQSITVAGRVYLGQPIQNEGRILLPWKGYIVASLYSELRLYCSYSDDNGATWNTVIIYDNFYVEMLKGIGVFNGDLVCIATKYAGSGDNVYAKISTDNGASWSNLATYPEPLDNHGFYDAFFWGGDGYNYWLNARSIESSPYFYTLYRCVDTTELTALNAFDRVNTWEEIGEHGFIGNDDMSELFWVTEDNNLAFAGTGVNTFNYLEDTEFANQTVSKINGGIKEDNTIQPKSIQISRSKGMAGQLTVEFDNKDGILAPDGTTNPALLWPNKEVTVKQGYGTELIQTFNGLIDTISISTFPQSITINARDKMKALLDHYVRDSSFNYVVTYTAQTVEAIWQDLTTKAGLTYGTVETTGITLAEKVFSWESYADAISWLDEIAGFETYCDEFGVMHFIYDGRPASPTTAYSFVEGVDIIQLGYDINDKDLYYSVVVYGKDANDAVVYYAATLPQAAYWNIPSGKVMRIDAPDADTSAKCQAIADKAIYLMQTRARQVHFETIGIPHLQRGDFIQVTESSTTISEIYRITDISTSQENGKYTMNLTCYYHAAPEV